MDKAHTLLNATEAESALKLKTKSAPAGGGVVTVVVKEAELFAGSLSSVSLATFARFVSRPTVEG